jgi:hypothetical protein
LFESRVAKYVNWIEQFNEVRKIWAPPYGRTYSDEDLLILRLIESELGRGSVNAGVARLALPDFA